MENKESNYLKTGMLSPWELLILEEMKKKEGEEQEKRNAESKI